MTKRKHGDGETEKLNLEDMETGATAAVAGRGREMQGQGEKKHTIDSDDEEEEREREMTFDKMKDDDIEGQEDNTLNMDGDIQITPFNLKEEQQEGTFSKDGNFVWNKKDEIKDAWLDDVDWIKVKERTASDIARRELEDEQEEETQEKYSEITAYREMLVLLTPGESVAKALRRLGGGKKAVSASERWKKKKTGAAEDPQEKQNKELMLKLTGLADSILTRSGNMQVYEETYESITYKLVKEDPKHKAKTDIPEEVDDDDALDMFADSLDTQTGSKDDANAAAKHENGAERAENVAEMAENGASVPTSAPEVPVQISNEVMWEFKWKNEEGEEVHGPHSSEKMLEWVESGFFQAGVWCRKVGSSSDFSSSKRIDFDLYT